MTQGDFALAVIAFCQSMGGSVTSWGRTVQRNMAVGGVDDSYHLDFLACDVVYDRTQLVELRVKKAKRFGLKLLDEMAAKSHDHLQPL